MKYKYGEKVVVKIPNSMFYNVKGEVIEFANKPYDMYIILVFEGIRIGVVEKYLTKLS